MLWRLERANLPFRRIDAPYAKAVGTRPTLRGRVSDGVFLTREQVDYLQHALSTLKNHLLTWCSNNGRAAYQIVLMHTCFGLRLSTCPGKLLSSQLNVTVLEVPEKREGLSTATVKEYHQ